MRRFLLLALGIIVLAAGFLYGEVAEVTKRTVWIVPYDHAGTLRVQPGDVIEVWTTPLPLVPDNLESRFRASTEGRGIELVGETLPHKEGTMERLYFFKAFEPGPAAIVVELVHRDGTVRDTWRYEVEVADASCQE
jgi:hypothetical protein